MRGLLLATAASLLAVGPTDPAAPPAAEPPEPTSLKLPPREPELQRGLERVLAAPRYRSLMQEGRLSIAVVDLSRPDDLRYAAVDDDRMRYAASLPKIGIMLGVFDRAEKGELTYTPALRRMLERVIRHSDNQAASDLIRLVGFEAIAAALRDPRCELYDSNREGGLWVGRGYGGGLGLWRRDPLHGISHGATARQAARFLVMMDRGELISPWASAEMKSIMGEPAIHHKFVRGLEQSRPGSGIFRKSGTWKEWHADAALVERDGEKYVAVALLESPSWSGVLSSLIVELDDLLLSRR